METATQVEAERGEVQSQHLAGAGVAGRPVTGGTLPQGWRRAYQGCSCRNTHVLQGRAKTSSEHVAR